MVLLKEGGWGGGRKLGLGVRIVMEQLKVTTNHLHIGKQHDGNNQLAMQYSTLILYHIISSQHKIFGLKKIYFCQPFYLKKYQSY